jgi:hypothetical protein
LEPDGNGFKAHGPADARAELKPLVLHHKAEILDILRSQGQPGARPIMPPDGPGEEWHRDFLGRPVNLAGLRKPAGLQ